MIDVVLLKEQIEAVVLSLVYHYNVKCHLEPDYYITWER